MDWQKGFSASYYATFVDKATWRDLERFEITEGSISYNTEELRCSATVGAVGYEQGTENVIRVYLDARQTGDAVLVPLFTGYATSPSQLFNGRLETNSLDVYSVLTPVKDVLLPRGWYAAAEIPGGDLIKKLLEPTPAPVSITDDSPALKEAIIAEDSETNLSMIEKILVAMDWRMRVGGDGTIQLLPNATEAEVTFDPLDNDAIEPEIEVTYDWYQCPNCMRAISGDLTAVAKDENEDSIFSIPRRGREVWMEDTDADLNEGETIEAYALRRLKEEQSVATQAKYKRRFHSELSVSDLVRLHYPEQGLDGLYKITSMSMELGYGCSVDEEVEKYG